MAWLRRPARIVALAVAVARVALAADAVAQGSAVSDRAALEALYDAAGGLGWTNDANWKTSTPLAGWYGVATDGAGRVTELVLRDNGLVGSIPLALGDLPALWLLDLRENALTGSIPGTLGGLENLVYLFFGENELTGRIPASLGNLAALQALDLEKNVLTGPIPGALGSLANLELLNLWANELAGPIPEELGSLADLERLSLGYNPLSGALPRSLTRLSRLRRLNASGTEACAPADPTFQEWLSTIDFLGNTCNRPPEAVDTIPAQALTEAGPAVGVSMHGYFNDPDGDPLSYAAATSHAGTVSVFVPGETVWLGPGAAGTARVTVMARDPDGLSASQAIVVDVAAASGPGSDREVLESLYDAAGGGDWTNGTNWKTSAPLAEWHGVTTDADGRVTGLHLGRNGLTGSIPPSLGVLAALRWLDLGGNELAGPLPNALGSLTNLEWLLLGGNALTGPVPAWLGNLLELRHLDLGANGLTGPIPSALGGLANLETLELGGNRLTGPPPDALGGLANLEWLSLGGNALTGPVPAWLGNLTALRRLDLGRNALTGPLPDAMGSLVNLETLVLEYNALTGPLPAWLENLAALQRLDLGDNGLTGSIPGALERLASLERLDLSYNWGLSGTLPQLPRLERLDTFVTRACAPAEWWGWLATTDFRGGLCGVGADVTIGVAVVYTATARSAAGGTAAIEALVDLMVAEANRAFAESGVRHRAALVDRSLVDYDETGESLLDLRRLNDASDGHLDEVHGLRDRVGADIVFLIVGHADFPRADLGGAFGLVAYDSGGLVFAHELGHNLGLWHDRYQVHHHEGGASPHPAYGYVNQRTLAAGATPPSRWRTVMSSLRQCEDAYTPCTPLPRFSNPRQRYAGDPMGTPFGTGSGVTGPADAAAVLAATVPAAALWRGNVPPAAVGTLPDRHLELHGRLDVDVSSAFLDPDGGVLRYTAASSAPSVATAVAAGARVTLTAMSLDAATIGVTATDPEGESATQTFTVTVSRSPPFTDHPLVPGVTPIRAVHFTELRSRIDGVRVAAGLGRRTWTDPVLSAGVTPARLEHLLELRSAVAEAYASAGRPAPSWSDAAPTRGATPIRAAHLLELRAAVVALE